MNKHVFIPFISAAVGMILIYVAGGCRSHRNQSAEKAEINRYYETVERIVMDTVYIRLPEADMSYAGPDTASRLETELARSSAWIDSAGLLHHTLSHKRSELPVRVPRKETSHTSRADSIMTRTVIKERELTPWQRLRLDAFGWVAGAAAIVVLASLMAVRKKGR